MNARTDSRRAPSVPPLVIPTLLEGLKRAGVTHVLTGSVAAAAWGVAVDPGDLDIAPELSAENLERLASLLEEWEARPHRFPASEWVAAPSAEECDAWRPIPATPEQLDQLLVTPHGLLDVVPRIAGAYDWLRPRAMARELHGLRVAVARPDDLIAPMRIGRKAKHRARIRHLLEAAEALRRGDVLGPRLP